MNTSLLNALENFKTTAGLSEHRAGLVLVNNGRLIERLRAGCRVWPDTEAKIRAAIARETIKRGLPMTPDRGGAAR